MPHPPEIVAGGSLLDWSNPLSPQHLFLVVCAAIVIFGFIVTRKVRRSEPIDHALHITRLVQIRPHVEVLHLPRHPEQRHEMPARARSPRRKHILPISILVRVRPQPADRRLAVLNLRREDGVLTEPIFHAGHGHPVFDHGEAGRIRLVTPTPSTTVDPDQHRPFRLRRQVEVELLLAVAILDVGQVEQYPGIFRHILRPLDGLRRRNRRRRLLRHRERSQSKCENCREEAASAAWESMSQHGRNKTNEASEVVGDPEDDGKDGEVTP